MATTYLDHNATSPLRPEARQAIEAALSITGNPSSVHASGRYARRIVEDARERVAALVGARPSQVIFTSGGTEANNLVLSASAAFRVLASAGEHDSVLRSLPEGATHIALTPGGTLDLKALDEALAALNGRSPMLCLMLANNETGAIQPVREAAGKIHALGGRLHCDAVQAFGRIAVDFATLGADSLTMSAHKIGGPAGVGALVLAEGVEYPPLLRGGGQERGRRAGTENLLGIAGFGAAAEAALRDLRDVSRIAALRGHLETGVLDATPQCLVFAREAERLANTSCIALPGRKSETLVMALDLAGIAVSAGSACSSGKITPSHVLTAMGASEQLAASAIRVSLGWSSSEADVETFLAAWRKLYAAGPEHRLASASG